MSAVKSNESREPSKKDGFKNERDVIVLDLRLISEGPVVASAGPFKVAYKPL